MNTTMNKLDRASRVAQYAVQIYRLIESDVDQGCYSDNAEVLASFSDCQDYVDANEYLIEVCQQSELQDFDLLNDVLAQVDMLMSYQPIFVPELGEV